MSTTITGDGTQPLSLTTTGPSDGPIADASDVNTPVQAVLNGTVRLGTFHVASLAALASYTGQQPNERIFVLGYGLYRYNQAGANTTDSPRYIAASGGTGRFEWELVTAAGAADGLATLNSSQRLVQIPQYATLAMSSVSLASAVAVTSTTYVDVTGMSISLSCAAGDILNISGLASAWLTGAASAYVKVIVVDGGTPSDVNLPQYIDGGTNTTNANPAIRPFSALYTVTTGPTVVVKLQAKTSANTLDVGGAAQSQNTTLQVVQVRP